MPLGTTLLVFLKKWAFCIVPILLAFNVHAQQNNNWTFGKEQGLNFNNDTLTLFNSDLNSEFKNSMRGNSATISDCDGNLLFYSNGQMVWNKNHDTMDNGNLISSQGNITYNKSNVIVIPFPSSVDKFIVAYFNQHTRLDIVNGLYYSIVDMSLNSGLGRVILKDSLLGHVDYSNTHLTWAKHANDTNFWIIAASSADSLKVYELNSSGINPQAKSHQINTYDLGKPKGNVYMGYLRMNHANNKLLIINNKLSESNLTGVLREFNFNRSTGGISNEKTLFTQSDLGSGWDLLNAQYSPNDSLIFILTTNYNNYRWNNALELNKIVQLELSSNKKRTVHTLNRFNFQSTLTPYSWLMQNTPNGRMVVVMSGHLYVINKPNKIGSQSEVKFIQDIYKPFSKGVHWEPYDIATTYTTDRILYFNQDAKLGKCQDTVAYTYLGDSTFYKLVWHWGDGDSTVVLPPNIKTGEVFKHRYKQDGTYQVRLQSFHATCDRKQEYKDEFVITIPPKLKIHSLGSGKSCAADTALLHLTLEDADSFMVNWGDGTTEVYFAADSHLHHAFTSEDTFHIQVASLKRNGCDVIKVLQFISSYNPKPDQRIAIGGFTDSAVYLGKSIFNTCGPWEIEAKDSSESNVWIYTGTDSFHQDSAYTVINTQKERYTVVSTNEFGCQSADSFYAFYREKPSLEYSITNLDSCLNSNKLSLNILTDFGGNADSLMNSIDWGDAMQDTFVQGGASHQYSQAGQYQVMLKSETRYCSFEDSLYFEVYTNPKAKINMLTDTFMCEGAGSFEVETSNANQQVYNWSDEYLDTAYSAMENKAYNFVGFGKKQLSLVERNAAGCSDTAVQELIIYAKPQLKVTSVDTICSNNFTEQVKAEVLNYNSVNIDTSFYWFTGHVNPRRFTSQTDSTISLAGSQGNQFVELWSRTIEGCSDTVRKPIYVRPVTLPLEDLPNELCIGDVYPFTLSASNGLPINVKWFVEDEFIDSGAGLNVRFTFKPEINNYNTIFNLKTVDGYGCYSNWYYSKSIYDKPVASFDERTVTSTPESKTLLFQNTSQGAVDYEWDIESYGTTNNKSPEVLFTDTGEFDILLLAINDGGCVDSARKTILIYPEVDFYIPNAITANGDGLNDFLQMPSPRFIKSLDFKIFNRWGEMIFKTQAANDQWVPTLEGNYVYVATIIDINGDKHNLKGRILVIK